MEMATWVDILLDKFGLSYEGKYNVMKRFYDAYVDSKCLDDFINNLRKAAVVMSKDEIAALSMLAGIVMDIEYFIDGVGVEWAEDIREVMCDDFVALNRLADRKDAELTGSVIKKLIEIHIGKGER